MTAFTPTFRPKSVRNRCVIEVFGGVFYVVTMLFGFFCGCMGVCHRTKSDLFLFVSMFLPNIWKPDSRYPCFYNQRQYLPEITIISDFWKAYDGLSKEGFNHLKVTHPVNFVDPDSGAHTNTIESTWRALKKSLPVSGTVKSLYDTYTSQNF